jgi:hypothetical protein
LRRSERSSRNSPTSITSWPPTREPKILTHVEKLGLERDRGTVDLDERTVAPERSGMDSSGDEEVLDHAAFPRIDVLAAGVINSYPPSAAL